MVGLAELGEAEVRSEVGAVGAAALLLVAVQEVWAVPPLDPRGLPCGGGNASLKRSRPAPRPPPRWVSLEHSHSYALGLPIRWPQIAWHARH